MALEPEERRAKSMGRQWGRRCESGTLGLRSQGRRKSVAVEGVLGVERQKRGFSGIVVVWLGKSFAVTGSPMGGRLAESRIGVKKIMPPGVRWSDSVVDRAPEQPSREILMACDKMGRAVGGSQQNGAALGQGREGNGSGAKFFPRQD